MSVILAPSEMGTRDIPFVQGIYLGATALQAA
jgi:hypothetical protein